MVNCTGNAAPDDAVTCTEVVAKARVCLQPPHRKLRDNQVVRSFSPKRFQLLDRFGTVCRVVAGEMSVAIAREMARGPLLNVDQLVFTIADDQRFRSFWNKGAR